ncbi:putative serine/threonine-protein kinase zyg-1 [Caenorhabditis elegans]|uniref:Probable serine/threonine-protein kinase zyg-1 n=1 Tax=Caenorhabditis elegans TaxID=6239 RepID=ZYG1_CAEEL|nr:putative serine/threonine-protein kinase zyg-1 [Caenorhabditis elegans]Q9GT24.1 RecName: Full=Probable serine/threonine-protein kinase zyg-1; AltName: Full=Zygote defective protein 1 [Caenorhabditis elegans]AAG15377.1 zygote defective-1 [Caenorhabditis elegans]CCD64966.1 Probable serine/threonine-protein kinase zyg-1 [Caenorhabditis elegans]|eukprot:NP_495103.1 Probable serine/threonine-protein kinase zyg-1 [Caenorhabditis elegans]
MSGGKSGSRLSAYSHLKEIGKGGFGVVYAAQRENGEKVAIKRIDKKVPKNRVWTEIQTMKELKKSKYVVEFYEDFVEDGYTYIVMELCEGGSLQAYVREHGALDDATAVHVLRQLISAVSFMHRVNVIHRDLSAGNVFIKDSKKKKMTVKLGDFGLATTLGRGETTCTIVGTPGFIAPQVYDQEYTQSADVYSLGAVLYTMLTARNPPPKGLPPTCGMSPNAARLVEQMMDTDAKKRIPLTQIVLSEFMYENTNENAVIFSREHSRDGRRQRSREPVRSSRDDRSRDGRALIRSSSQPAHSGRAPLSNRPIHDRMPSTSSRGFDSERGRERDRDSGRGTVPPSREDRNRSQLWPIRMDRLEGQRVCTAGGRYIVELDTRCRFEVAAQGNFVKRILIVEVDEMVQTVYVHRIPDRTVRGRNGEEELITLTNNPFVYTSYSQMPKEVQNDYMRLQKMVAVTISGRVAKVTFRRPSQFPDAQAQLMENGDLRIKLPRSVIVRKMDNGEIFNCIDGIATQKQAVSGITLTKVNEVYKYLIRFEQCLNGMDRGMVCFPIVFSAGTNMVGSSPSSLMPSGSSQTSRFPFSNLSNNQPSLVPHSAPFLTKPTSSQRASSANVQRRVSTDENSSPSVAPSKYKIKIDPTTQKVRSIQATDGRVLRCSTSKADQFIFTDPAIRPDDQRFMRTDRVPDRASEMLHTLCERMRKLHQ